MGRFDEASYIEINAARWAMAENVLNNIQNRCQVDLVTCLDIGCGPGWFSERLAARGLIVEGVDGRPEILAEAQQRVPSVRFHHADIESEMQTGLSGSYDLVFCFGLLYHTENPFRVIRSLRRFVKKVLFIESIVIPGTEPNLWLVSENENETQGLTYQALIPSRSSMLKMLQCSGFEYVYEYVGPVNHVDFEETPTRYQRRRVFLASTIELPIDSVIRAPEIATPKYNFMKTLTTGEL